MLFRVAPDIDAFIKLSSNAPSRTPFDAPNSILTTLIVLVSLLSPSLLSTLFICDVYCASCLVVFQLQGYSAQNFDVLDPFHIAHNRALYALPVYKMNKLVHSYSLLLSAPGRYNYSIAFAMLVSVYMRRIGGWFAFNVSIEFGYCLRIT
jgi:hypothetical protein